MKKMIYETNYERMQKIGFFNLKEIEDHRRIKNEPYMDLSVEVIWKTDKYADFPICHYGEQNGDLMRDPEMVVRVYHDMKMCEALSWRNDYIGVFHEVYPEPGKFIPKYKKDLNSFLRSWLINIKEQGFRVNP